jgi:predicted CXXCH cytochrome family protein
MKGGLGMFRFYGGLTVGKGTYWNLSTGESIEVKDESLLPGNRHVKYLRIPAIGVIMLGPFIGLLFICSIPLMSLIFTLALLPRIALASDALKSDEASMCMGCHAEQGMVKTFKNKEKLSVQLTGSHFKDTVHSFLTCTSCHSDVSMDKHPSAQYASRREFAVHVSKSCKACHPEEQIYAKPMHQHAITKANAPPCSDCHGSHSIRKVQEWKEKVASSQYCLTCHKQELSITINGETISLSVKEENLRKSVHSNHNCSDCHDSFSKKNHPIKSFGSKRDLSISISEVCKRCHAEKYKQYEGSIHSDMLTKGIQAAPVCTDCHGSHSVGHKAMLETLSGAPCRKCHEGIFEAYKGSVHGIAKINAKGTAPLCSSCHYAHEVKPALVSRSPKDTCIGCHKNAADTHSLWLPNSGIHLDTVACTACHVSEAENKVYLHLTDSDGTIVPEHKVKEYLGKGYEVLTSRKQSRIEGQQLWSMYRTLGDSGSNVAIKGTIGIQDCKISHNIAPKAKALRQCDSCHNANSNFFKNVSMAVISKDGQENFYNLNPVVLNSMFAILPLNQFYVLGSTRLKILDILGVLMVIGGISVPIAHITLRILTSPIREARRLNELRKEGKR